MYKMENSIEKFEIKIEDRKLVITSIEYDKKKTLHFKPGEALILLDILKNEEKNLKQLALEDSPIPIQINV